MNTTHFLSSPQLFFPSIQSTLKNPKPPNSLSSNATSFFLQNPSFSPQTPKINNEIKEDITQNHNDNAGVRQNLEDNSDNNMIKMPTAPWMKTPLFVDSNEVIDITRPKIKRKVSKFDGIEADNSLTGKISGRFGKKAVKKLVQSIEKLQVSTNFESALKNLDATLENWSDTQKNWDDFGSTQINFDSTQKKLDETLENWDVTQKNWDTTQKNWGDFEGDHKNWDGAPQKLDSTRNNFDKTRKKLDMTQNNVDSTFIKLDGTPKNWGDSGHGFLKEDDFQEIWDSAPKIWYNPHKNRDGAAKKRGDFRGGFTRGDGERKKLGEKKMMPWERNERKMVFRREKREKVESGIEFRIDDKELLERLRNEASKMRKWVKVKKLGVTLDVVSEVHSIWANNELVMFKFDLPLCRNMYRAREIVEIKTGGLVVWCKKDSLVAYRGCDYHIRRRFRKSNVEKGQAFSSVIDKQKLESNITSTTENKDGRHISNGMFMDMNLWNNPIDKSLYEREGDRLLDGLGPRFIDWWYPKPLPVDGDLLPEVVTGFLPPFRRCAPRVRPQLRDDELTYLRTLARQLPVHFVLGRNSKLQGLAVAILKLWQKSVIVKIAVKWGVQNTNNEAMASELQRLTGGVLLLRNKFIIILYRGKDFLPGNVANVIAESEMQLQQWQLHEEDARLKADGILDANDKISADTSIIGTLAEYEHIRTVCCNSNFRTSEAHIKLEAEKERLKKELRTQEHKLGFLKLKIAKAERVLTKLNVTWKPSEQEPDQELLTEEERVCFRKIGLKMDSVLVLGRRGVFDGVIEGLYQHWKHREVVKVITMQRRPLQVIYTARFLERESGGVLVSVDKLKEGHAIIIYRGKNYKRPLDLGDNLLDKKKALERSVQMQRRGSLNFFAHQREKNIVDLRLKLEELESSDEIF